MSFEAEVSFDDRLNSVLDTLDREEQEQTNNDGKNPDPDAIVNAELPEKAAIGKDQLKTSEDGETEQEAVEAPAIRMPSSWPSDDEEAFKALPTWVQERLVTRETERETHFTHRSQSLAARERELQDFQARTTQAQAQYSSELDRLNQLATQLMPAKFADISSEADYLRLKVEDPARASEYEAFVHMIRNANQQKTQVEQERINAHLHNEFQQLTSKYPEFQDQEKAASILGNVRKACVDWYGFSPQEVEIIADHRHVPIIRDAIAWRQYQANIKAAESKRVPLQAPTATLRQNGQSSDFVGAEQKSKIINRARQTHDMRARAEMLAGLI